MGFIGDLFSSDKGAGYQAQSAPIQTQGNLGSDIQNAQASQNTQLGNQLVTQGQLAGQNGIGIQNTLAQQLLAQSQGGGPNPAADMLTAATGQNIQQAAGTIAGTKGINPALAARLAAQNQASTNQQAANQAAVLRANQQLSAQQQLGGLAQNQVSNLLGQQTQVANQGLQQQNILQNAFANQNQAQIQNAGQQNAANAGVAARNAENQGKIFSGIANSSGQAGQFFAGMAMGAAHGAVVPGQARVPGDSPKNDTVPAMLSPGEIVIPRSASKDPEKAKAFIDHIMKQSKASGEPEGYAKVLRAHKALEKRIKKLEESDEE